MKVCVIALVLAFMLSLVALIPAAQAAEAEDMNEAAAKKEALAAAESWLSLIDSGAYEQSWEESATLFQNYLGKAEWAKSLKALRQPLGSVVERSVEKALFVTEIPGAPDGYYVLIQYATQFANKKNAVETVTPMLDRDGTWRVSGYYIK